MGGFLQNNVAGGQSEFFLPSTVTASMRQIRNISTLNNIPIEDYGTPLGAVIVYAGLSTGLPSGFLLCDGSFVSQATYSRLYAIIANRYDYSASAPAGTFALPDLRQKAVFGASVGSAWEFYTFPITAQSWDTLTVGTNTAPINPATGSAYPSLQVVYVSVLSPAGSIYPGMVLQAPSINQSRDIIGVINSTSSYTTGGGVGVILILATAFSVPLAPAGCLVFNSGSKNGAMGATLFQNQTIQAQNEVGVHNHQQKQPSQRSTALPGFDLKAGNVDENGPNTNNNNNTGTFTFNSVQYTLPYSMNNQPSAVNMNYIIKYQ